MEYFLSDKLVKQKCCC